MREGAALSAYILQVYSSSHNLHSGTPWEIALEHSLHPTLDGVVSHPQFLHFGVGHGEHKPSFCSLPHISLGYYAITNILTSYIFIFTYMLNTMHILSIILTYVYVYIRQCSYIVFTLKLHKSSVGRALHTSPLGTNIPVV